MSEMVKFVSQKIKADGCKLSITEIEGIVQKVAQEEEKEEKQ